MLDFRALRGREWRTESPLPPNPRRSESVRQVAVFPLRTAYFSLEIILARLPPPPLPATQCPEIQHFSAWILAAAQAGPSPGPRFRSDPACASVTRQLCHLWRSGPRRSMWLPAGLSVVAPLGVAILGPRQVINCPFSGPGCGSPMGRGSARRDRRTGRPVRRPPIGAGKQVPSLADRP